MGRTHIIQYRPLPLRDWIHDHQRRKIQFLPCSGKGLCPQGNRIWPKAMVATVFEMDSCSDSSYLEGSPWNDCGTASRI